MSRTSRRIEYAMKRRAKLAAWRADGTGAAPLERSTITMHGATAKNNERTYSESPEVAAMGNVCPDQLATDRLRLLKGDSK